MLNATSTNVWLKDELEGKQRLEGYFVALCKARGWQTNAIGEFRLHMSVAAHMYKQTKAEQPTDKIELRKWHQTIHRRTYLQMKGKYVMPVLNKALAAYFNFRRNTCSTERSINQCTQDSCGNAHVP